MRKNKLKNNAGITLIALIITIIVMLILAGVTINLTLGENGIFTTAQIVAKNYTDAQNKELEDLNNFDTLLNNTVSNAQKTLNGSWSSKNKVNKPNLANTGLTPVTINSNGTYGTPDIEADNWYSYDGTTNKWANARTKDGSMWVWIPRFAYKITYIDATDKSKGGTIDVVFLQDTTDNYYNENGELKTAQRVTLDNKDTLDTTADYTVHPAFTNETSLNYQNGGWDKEIPGFWMAKFEAGYAGDEGKAASAIDSNVSYSTIVTYIGSKLEEYDKEYYGTRGIGTKIKYPTFQANRQSICCISIGDAFELAKDVQKGKEMYGLSNIDSHMAKNSEWGAVTYLAHSEFGKNGKEIARNNIYIQGDKSKRGITGYAMNEMMETTWQKVLSNTESGNWVTRQGQTSSTTGNVYGIYDLSGGAWEWTAGYLLQGANYDLYAGNLKGESNRYKTMYEGSSDSNGDNYSEIENMKKIGEAINEISSKESGRSGWFGAATEFVNVGRPFFIRGGKWDYTNNFAFGQEGGFGKYDQSFRVILIPSI